KKPVAKKAAPKPELHIDDRTKKAKKLSTPEIEKREDRVGGLPGWAGLLIGIAIIVLVIGSSFLLGYYV
ncbi:MAG: hypothetical protein KAG04_00820, partial [Mycoplasmataceae bacterium]|nr:hypothetical protein [Mycoplasmataceae bacterium]